MKRITLQCIWQTRPMATMSGPRLCPRGGCDGEALGDHEGGIKTKDKLTKSGSSGRLD
jgi:hypothetical protein